MRVDPERVPARGRADTIVGRPQVNHVVLGNACSQSWSEKARFVISAGLQPTDRELDPAMASWRCLRAVVAPLADRRSALGDVAVGPVQAGVDG